MPIKPHSPCTYCGKPAVDRGRCARHRRPNTVGRGYGPPHKALRSYWAPKVAAGRIRCARCHQYIQPGESWDLGHHDRDRSQYNGPEHANDCNRAAGGRSTPR